MIKKTLIASRHTISAVLAKKIKLKYVHYNKFFSEHLKNNLQSEDKVNIISEHINRQYHQNNQLNETQQNLSSLNDSSNNPSKSDNQNINFKNDNEKTPETITEYIYIHNDKFSITPEKEVQIKKQTFNSFLKQKRNKYKYTYKITNLNKLDSYTDNIRKNLKQVFLPRDYPSSVKPGYLKFTKYSFFASTGFFILSFLSSQSLISAFGYSTSTSRYVSASMNWVLKDGMGQIGSIFFSAKFSNSIERDLRKWRVISNLMFSTSALFDIAALHNPEYFLIFASIGTICMYDNFLT